jgi:hypothetical protein
MKSIWIKIRMEFSPRRHVLGRATALSKGVVYARRQGSMSVQREAEPVETGQMASFESCEEAGWCIKRLDTESSVSTTDKIQTA